MTRQDQLTAIRTACINANPDIDEGVTMVQVGSRVVFSLKALEAGIKHRTVAGTVVGESRDKTCWRVKWPTTTNQAQNYAKEFLVPMTIAVRPIRLADVLLTISGKSYRPEAALKNRYHITANGIFVDYLTRPTNTGVFWNLRQDDLALQSNETISFLADLFK